MKRVLQIVLALGFGFFALTGASSAQQQQSCTIDNTGPESVNVCVNSSTVSCTVDNENVISIGDDTYQGSESGDAIVYNNTTGGGATSGSTSNSNSTNVNIVVSNDDECTVTTTTRTVIVPPVVTPATPKASTPVVKTLPKTNGTSPAVFAGATVAVLLGAIVASRFGLAAYSKLKG